MPYGSTQPENVESVSDDLEELNRKLNDTENFTRPKKYLADGPLLLFYDQEPILGEFNHPLFNSIKKLLGPHILVTTEKESDPLDKILHLYRWKSVYYFHHAFAAHDWYRGYRYDARLIDPKDRIIKKKFITFNRITSSSRVYRSLLVSELVKRDILDQGYVSYSDVCTENQQDYVANLNSAKDLGLITTELMNEVIENISQAPLPLRIDFTDEQFIPNNSFQLGAIEQTQESFCFLVTETCYWERKHHLTEKIFKPIVSKMPFVLAGPAHNLKYLREYGFKTFSPWIDESYDDIEDPILRMGAIGDTMSKICSLSEQQLYDILQEMQPVLEHNHSLFYSNEFLDYCWNELLDNIRSAVNES